MNEPKPPPQHLVPQPGCWKYVCSWEKQREWRDHVWAGNKTHPQLIASPPESQPLGPSSCLGAQPDRRGRWPVAASWGTLRHLRFFPGLCFPLRQGGVFWGLAHLGQLPGRDSHCRAEDEEMAVCARVGPALSACLPSQRPLTTSLEESLKEHFQGQGEGGSF